MRGSDIAEGFACIDLLGHGVGVDQDGADRFRASGAALAWCPTSNLFLFGRTVPPAMLDDVLLSLRSDASPTVIG